MGKWRVDDLQEDAVYKLLAGSVVPRPIAWVCTVSRDGIVNLAPFSFFTVASRMPPSVIISIGRSVRSETTSKDTLANLTETGECTINIASAGQMQKLQETSQDFAASVDETQHLGIATCLSDVVNPPGVLECKVRLECALSQLITLGTDTIAIVEVLQFHVDDSTISDKFHIDPQILDPLARMGGPRFARQFQVIDAPSNISAQNPE